MQQDGDTYGRSTTAFQSMMLAPPVELRRIYPWYCCVCCGEIVEKRVLEAFTHCVFVSMFMTGSWTDGNLRSASLGSTGKNCFTWWGYPFLFEELFGWCVVTRQYQLDEI